MEDELDIDELLAKSRFIKSLTRPELEAYLEDVRDALSWLDENEPKKKKGEDFELWCDCHEDLEDLADELAERLL